MPRYDDVGPRLGAVDSPSGDSVGEWVRGALRRLTDPSIALVSTQLVTAGGAAVVNVLAARALDPSGRGQLALLLQIAYLSTQGVLLGTDRSLTAIYHDEAPRPVASASLRLLTVPALVTTSLVGTLALVLLASGHSWWRTVAVTGLFTVVNAFVRGARAVAIATGRQGGFVWLTLVTQALLLTALVTLYFTAVDDVTVWLLAYPLAAGIPTALFYGRLVRRQPLMSPVGDDVRRARVRREGLVLLPSALASMGMLRADRFVLPALSSTATLGIYASVATMTELLTWPLQAVADSRLGAWRAADELGQLAIRRILAWALVYTVVSAAVLGWLTHALIVPLFGAAYEPARLLVAPLVLAAGVFGLSRVGITLLVARRFNAMASGAEGVGFATSMAAYLVFIPRIGALGAAYGSILGYSGSLLFTLVVLRYGRRSAAPSSPPRDTPGDAGTAAP